MCHCCKGVCQGNPDEIGLPGKEEEEEDVPDPYFICDECDTFIQKMNDFYIYNKYFDVKIYPKISNDSNYFSDEEESIERNKTDVSCYVC